MEYHRLMASLRLAQGRADEAVTDARAALAWSQQAMPGARHAQRLLREALARAEAAWAGQRDPAPITNSPAASHPASTQLDRHDEHTGFRALSGRS
jgi:hypothetical protein